MNKPKKSKNLITSFKHSIADFFEATGQLSAFIGKFFRVGFRPRYEHKELLNQCYLIGYNIPVSTFIERGRPASVIIELSRSWNADMIVLGTHGRKGLSHLLMGSVAEEVMRNSSKPLVIIPISEKR
ncbi:universal stress protein [Pedobacter kyonggii]|uniref:UspA domain-containing protein n=1 Tax=Pedobacter kyonggii TaxID=1926871 RepID=A0A4Q9HFD1_9SPHI|nr:universal stress protein [Pedobacter kyonggii]TBO43642.1 hypothetical protein EYS08_06740 [Pedobacter kyonggii]